MERKKIKKSQGGKKRRLKLIIFTIEINFNKMTPQEEYGAKARGDNY